ncbi:E3 ubiquitin-protein ligase Rnf220-like [Nothoprocta perdicaria]|uniref:E3 ubiquitin-protein ligase Rnf220-like n=1 Tax=Nothoprocta perdicaria TaxID=30464 RepID=UPI000E1C0B30|nr:E3 ubiquitin-protein ligase Rnf220-like [Nothoprocta perdicaria]
MCMLLEGNDAPVISPAPFPRPRFPFRPGKIVLLAILLRKETPMDLHRAAFKMENSPYLPNPLASPALMVLASTAEASRDASIPCQQPRPFGVPVSADKDVHIPFTNGSYTFASMYHRQGGVPGAFANRDFPPSLLHLHPQFAPPNLDCAPISMLNHSGVGAFRPFASAEDRESYQSAFTPAKRLKNCHDTDSPHLRFSDADGKEYEFGTQLPSSSPGSLKVDETGKKIFAVSGLISDRETSSSPEERSDRSPAYIQNKLQKVSSGTWSVQEGMEADFGLIEKLFVRNLCSRTWDCDMAVYPWALLLLQLLQRGNVSLYATWSPACPQHVHT